MMLYKVNDQKYIQKWNLTFINLAKWFNDLTEDCVADLGGAESLHEMSARKNRRAKRKKKTQEDKIKKVKALLKPHPGQ